MKQTHRWSIGSAVLRFMILTVAQATAGALALTAFAAARRANVGWARWDQIVASLAEYLVVVPLLLLMIKVGGGRATTVLKLRAPVWWSYPVALFMIALAGPWRALIQRWLHGERSAVAMEFEIQPTPMWLATLFMAVVMAPIVEEAVHRGYLFSILERRSALVAAIGSSLMFSLVHVNPLSPWSCLQQLPIAIPLAVCMIRFRSLYPLIVAHAAWNLLSRVGISPVRWFAPTLMPVLIASVLFVIVSIVLLRQSRSSLRV